MMRRRGPIVVASLLVLLAAALADVGLLDPLRVVRGVRNLGEFAVALFPPDPSSLPTLAEAMFETIEIAFVGTAIGFALALPLSLAASPVLFGPAVTAPVKVFLAAVRTVPALFWAIVFVVAVGLGPAAGALGVALIPEAANGILAQLLFMFEYNVRASSIMGFVGAGGIGFYILGYLGLLRYDLLLTALLLTLLVVVAIDRASSVIRRMFLHPVARVPPAE
jgi:phosphonate transport system permease protein